MEKSYVFSSESSLGKRLGGYSHEYKAKDKTPGARDPQNFCKRELSFVFPKTLKKKGFIYFYLMHGLLSAYMSACGACGGQKRT